MKPTRAGRGSRTLDSDVVFENIAADATWLECFGERFRIAAKDGRVLIEPSACAGLAPALESQMAPARVVTLITPDGASPVV